MRDWRRREKVKVEIYDKGENLIAEWEVDGETCERFSQLDNNTLLFEIATGIAVALKEESGVELTPNMVINELGKVVVCGREIKLS